jgi:hypothetical protein
VMCLEGRDLIFAPRVETIGAALVALHTDCGIV